MGHGGRAYFRWVLGQFGRRDQQCRSGTEIGSGLRASLPLCGGEGANRRREASFRASVEGLDSFEARVSPVLRCRRLSSHRTPTWNARFGRSKCTIAAKVPAKTGTTISYAMAAALQVRRETRDRHQEQLNRYRFRHRPLAYLAFLETRWDQATWTGVLPP